MDSPNIRIWTGDKLHQYVLQYIVEKQSHVLAINDGGDGEDTGEFSQPWTRVKSKARKALTTQNARNNSNNRSNKQKLRLSEHDIHNTPGRDSRRRSYSDVTRSTMTCQFCAEPGHSTRDSGFGDYATFRQCGQEGHKQKFCHAYTC